MAELKDQLNEEKAEKLRLDDLLSRVQDDKKKLANRVNKLTASGRSS